MSYSGASRCGRVLLIALISAAAIHCSEGQQAEVQDEPSNPNLYQKEFGSHQDIELSEAEEQRIAQEMWRVWIKRRPAFRNQFLGVRTLQNPLDVWIIQEIISKVKPDFIIEAGTLQGGSAMLWAMFLEQVNPEGRVITIDIEDQRTRKAKEYPIARSKVDFILGSSTDPRIVEEVRRRVEGKKVLVLLDSLHTKEHVAGELAAYAPMVSKGSYVIVQDTLAGVREAIAEFLAGNDQFEADRSKERYILTVSESGYLRRL